MKQIKLLIGILFLPIFSFCTGQAGDILIWNGDTTYVFSNPLQARLDIDFLQLKMFGENEAGLNTACWRGYIAEWTIEDKELFLTNIYSCNYSDDSIKADLSELFGYEFFDGKVNANWFTGDLVIPQGELIHYFHAGYEYFYEKETELNLKEGKVVGQVDYNNDKLHKSIYSPTNYNAKRRLNEFVHERIDWNAIPDLEDLKIKVFVLLHSGEIPKPEIVKVVRKSDIEILNEEAIRVAGEILDWDVFYRRGKFHKVSYVLPIIYSEKNRLKYAN